MEPKFSFRIFGLVIIGLLLAFMTIPGFGACLLPGSPDEGVAAAMIRA